MNFKKDGGPAYPVPVTYFGDSDEYQGMQTGMNTGWAEGMTLRDWFAGQALAGVMAASSSISSMTNADKKLAGVAYLIADAMLKARETSND